MIAIPVTPEGTAIVAGLALALAVPAFIFALFGIIGDLRRKR